MSMKQCLWIVVAVTGLWAPVASADAYIDKARELMDQAEYERASKVLRLGLAREEVGGDLMVDHFELQAVCFVSLGQKQQAKSAYAKILTIRPGFSLPANTSPKIREIYDATYQSMKKAGMLRSTFKPVHVPISTKTGGLGAQAALKFEENADEISKVQLSVRRLGTAAYTTINAKPEGDSFVADIPAYLLPAEEEAYAMEYYFAALDSQGFPAAQVGNKDLPLSFLVVSKREIEVGEELSSGTTLLWIPVVVSVAVGAVALIGAGTAAGVGYFVFRPRRGSATVTVRQAGVE